jgi:RimJ/RimL family protein N-acetyltransferase
VTEFAIETPRLIVRAWRRTDAEPFQRINSDPEVQRYLGIRGTREESNAALARQQASQAELGYCFWALERKADGAFLGFCGVRPGVPDTPIEDDLEIGWRLGSSFWGQGYAREAAAACLHWAFATLDAPRIAAITVPGNVRSWRLMERLGMVRRPDLDFLHPRLPEGDPLRFHVTYVKDRP